MTLTVKQKLFVEAYLQNGGNARAAAVAAGYSQKCAKEVGYENLTKPYIAEMIKTRSQAVVSEVQSITDRIVLERSRLAFYDPRKLFHNDGTPKGIHELDDDTAAVISGVDVQRIGGGDEVAGSVIKYKLANKDSSLAALERINRMYDDKSSTHDTFNIQINIGSAAR